jgi:UDP-2,3-diacylglucosamine pyrophosphatase LpxH
MIVAVSDLHLGDKAANRSGFFDFIEGYLKPNAEDITHLFLLGDIFDLWRRNNETVILENIDILDSIRSLGFRVFYLVGNHDFIMTEMTGKYPGLTPHASSDVNPGDITVCITHQLTDGDRKFRFIHGHQIDYWYALPFYQAFCKAMCSVDEKEETPPNIWELLLSFSENMSPIVSSRISQLSEGTRKKIEQKLAGPLEESTMSKEESTLVELDLLRQFIEIGQLCPTTSNTDSFESIRNEVRALSNSFRKCVSVPPSIEKLSRAASRGTPEEMVSRFIMTWSDINRWFLESERNGMKPDKKSQLVHHIRRVAAMLTVNLRPDEFLIHGHGHIPFVNLKTRTADTGCWLRDKGSFISIEDGKVTSMPWSIT